MFDASRQNLSQAGFSPRVTLLGSLPPQRGISAYCLELSRSLAAILPVRFLSFRDMYPSFLYPGGSTTRDDASGLPPPIENLTVERRLRWYDPLGWIRTGLQAPGDLLHAQWWSLPLAPIFLAVCGGFRLRGKPVVLTVHNVLPHEPSLLFRVISMLLFRLADRLIVHTSDNRDTLCRVFGYPRHRIHVIPHGPLLFPADTETDPEKSRRVLGFLPAHKVILFFGAIREYKGLDTLLSAFPQVLQSVPEARLLIAGSMWENQGRYERQIQKQGLAAHVHMHARYVPSREVHRFFQAADLVALPYRKFQSQSGVGATAVAFRKPMIVTRVGGLPQLVRSPDCVVPPGDPERLARSIIRVITDPDRLNDLANDADAIARTISWPAIAESTVSIYHQLIQEKGSGLRRMASP